MVDKLDESYFLMVYSYSVTYCMEFSVVESEISR